MRYEPEHTEVAATYSGILKVKINEKEELLVRNVGTIRHLCSKTKGSQDIYGMKGQTDDMGHYSHSLGSMGEYAAAKSIMIPWYPTWNNGKLPDLPYGIHVRTRSCVENRDLIIRPDDPDDGIFVLVKHVQSDKKYPYWVFGWVWGHESRKYKLKDPGEKGDFAHLVPHRDLRKMVELVVMINERRQQSVIRDTP
jgi:hypothetical protein